MTASAANLALANELERAAEFTAPTREDMLTVARRAVAVGTPKVPEYPVTALGPLADVAQAISEGAQLRVAMAGQSVLTVAALVSQHRANVRSLDSIKPLQVSALTIADSGDGKTTCDAAAQYAVQARQRDDARAFGRELDDWENASKKDRGPQPREPYRVARDGTVEGIRRGFAQGMPSQAVFSSEAAAMLSGYGMSPEHRSKTAATLNALWDDGELSVSRAMSGRIQLYDRRLSIHWLIQPSAVEDLLADPSLSAMGFWPRFLVAWPQPAPPRRARLWDPGKDSRIGPFWKRCTAMLEGPMREDCSNLPVREPSPEALGLLGQFFERMERAAKGSGAELADIKPFAIRAAEHAARIAGVLAEFGGAREVDTGAMRGGIALAAYSLDTWRGIFGDRDRAIAGARAMKLYEWLLGQIGWSASETAMLRVGPKSLRTRERRDTCLATLEQAGLVAREGRNWSATVGGQHARV